MKAAGLSGIPPHVVVPISALGIAVFFAFAALVRRSWPPLHREAVIFFAVSGALGFVIPFVLESMVAPRLPVFLFIVIISTMPLITTSIAALLRLELLDRSKVAAVLVGFAAVLLILWDTASDISSARASWIWVLIAFAVPVLYALNTLFVASRWPKSADAVQVALAQALIVSSAALLASLISGRVSEWGLVAENVPAIGAIILGEGFALLLYLKITRDHGATFVALANYVAIFCAAILGALWFGDRISWLSALAALGLVAALSLRNRGSGA